MEDAITKCSRAKHCNVNICPLDKDSFLRNKIDDEKKCDMAKSIRLRIGTECGLPKLGLTTAEYSAFQKWNGRSEEEKNEIRIQMSKVRAKMPSQNRL